MLTRHSFWHRMMAFMWRSLAHGTEPVFLQLSWNKLTSKFEFFVFFFSLWCFKRARFQCNSFYNDVIQHAYAKYFLGIKRLTSWLFINKFICCIFLKKFQQYLLNYYWISNILQKNFVDFSRQIFNISLIFNI